MFTLNNSKFWQGTSLIVLIMLTRMNHFGDHLYLPDATLAALFLGGLLVARGSWLALAISVAFALDFYVLGFKGVSEYCMSLGYWGLIPTYAAIWGAGRWLATREQPFAALPYSIIAWAATSVAFVLSNTFWYSFSDKFETLTVVEFTQLVAKYYTPYVGFALIYLAAAWLVMKALSTLNLGAKVTSA